jgi:hypothetical protein
MLATAAMELDPMLPGRLRSSLAVPEGARFSELESWRQAPTRVSGPGMVRALDRAAELSGLRVREVDCSAVPANRIAAMARYGLSSKAPILGALAEPRRTATLVATTRHLDAAAVDDALDLFALLMATKLVNPARTASNTQRLASLPRLERASRMLARANRQLLATLENTKGGVDVAAVWAALERIAPRTGLSGAIDTVEELVPDEGNAEAAVRVVLAERYRTVRPFLLLLAEALPLAAAPAGEAVLAALHGLPAVVVARKVKTKPLQPAEIDRDLVPSMWRRAVYHNPQLPDGVVDRDAYVLCVLEQLHKALRVRDVYATPSHRWGDPRAQLLTGARWEAIRPQILSGLGLTNPVHTHLRGLTTALDAVGGNCPTGCTSPGMNPVCASSQRRMGGCG